MLRVNVPWEWGDSKGIPFFLLEGTTHDSGAMAVRPAISSIWRPDLLADRRTIWAVFCASMISPRVLCTPSCISFSVLVVTGMPSTRLMLFLMSALILFSSDRDQFSAEAT